MDLRRVERQWSQSRDASDDAALLRGKVRAGQLDPERLRLGAGLADPAAIFAWGAAASRLSLSDLVSHPDAEVRVRTWLGVGQAVYQAHPEPEQEAMLCHLGLKLLAGVKADRLDRSDRRGEEISLTEDRSLRLSWWAFYDSAPGRMGRVLARALERWIAQLDDLHVGQVDLDPHAEHALRCLLVRSPLRVGAAEAQLTAWALQRSDPLEQWLKLHAPAARPGPVLRPGDPGFVNAVEAMQTYGYAEGRAESYLELRQFVRDLVEVATLENMLALASLYVSDDQSAELAGLDDTQAVRRRLRTWLQ